MPKIEITDLHAVTIDGVAAGHVVDVLANHYAPNVKPADLKPEHAEGRAALKAALDTWRASLHAKHAADLDAASKQHADTCAAHEQALKDLAAKHGQELQAQAEQHKAKLDEYTAANADLRAQVDALGGTELGQRLAREKQRQAHLETIAKHQAELAKLDAAGA